MEGKYQEILEGAGKVFSRNGIRCVSMDDISKELGISKKTLYQHFSNKADLIESVLDLIFEKGKSKEAEFRKKKLNAIDTLLEVSSYLSIKKKEAHPIVSFELKKYYPELYSKQLERTRLTTLEHVKKNLEQGISEGLYRDNIDVEMIASLYLKDIENMLDEDFFCTKQFSFPRIFKAMFENYIRGIANEEGIRYFESKKEEIIKMINQE